MEKLPGSVSRWMAGTAGVLAALALSACGGGGGSDVSAAGSGTLQVSMTDAPSCGFDHVWVTVEKVRVHQSATAPDEASGWQDVTLATPQRIDLLNLTNGVLQTLGSTTLPAGDYSQLRLQLASNGGQQPLANAVQPTGGQPVALDTPSAQQSGLKLPVHFTVQANQMVDLVIDFDACKSVVKAGRSGKYILKPVLSVTPKFASSIQGYVTTTLTLNATTVSAQQNGNIIRSTTPDATGKFTLAFLPDGNYNVVVTSDAHATGVVTGVPVSTTGGTTTINGTTTAIVLPTSVMNTVTGTVTATQTTASGTGTAVVTDATVAALQSVAGATVQVASTPVDLDLATYTFRLPAAAPVAAPYSTNALVLAPDATAAGKYTLQVTAPGRATQTKPVDVSTATTPTTVNFSY